MSDDSTVHGEFESLSEQQCKEYLEVAVVGRLAYAGAEHIEILPVNYVYRDPHVLIRTSPYGPLAALAPGVDGVAFEVDHHSDLTQSGWSVVAAGRIEAVQDTAELDALWSSPTPRPWAAGTRSLYLRLTPTSLTGRSVRRHS